MKSGKQARADPKKMMRKSTSLNRCLGLLASRIVEFVSSFLPLELRHRVLRRSRLFHQAGRRKTHCPQHESQDSKGPRCADAADHTIRRHAHDSGAETAATKDDACCETAALSKPLQRCCRARLDGVREATGSK